MTKFKNILHMLDRERGLLSRRVVNKLSLIKRVIFRKAQTIATKFLNSKSFAKLSESKGFSLPSILVGIVILLIILISVTGVFIFIIHSAKVNQYRLIASNLAREYAENVRYIVYDDVGTIGGNPPGVLEHTVTRTVGNADFRLESRVWWVEDTLMDDMTAYKKLEISVWGPAILKEGEAKYAKHGTYVSFEGEKRLYEGGNIKIVSFWGDRGLFVRDLRVQLTANNLGFSQVGWTDDGGVKIFGDLEEDSYSITADPEGLNMMHRPIGASGSDWEYDDEKTVMVTDYHTSYCNFFIEWPVHVDLNMVDTSGDPVSVEDYVNGLTFYVGPSGVVPGYGIEFDLNTDSDVDDLTDTNFWPGWHYNLRIADSSDEDNFYLKDDWGGLVVLPLGHSELREVTLTVKLAVSSNPLAEFVCTHDEIELFVDGHLDAEIFYTTDGSVPDSSSEKYVDPIPVGSGLNLRVIAYKSGMLKSDVQDMVFTLD